MKTFRLIAVRILLVCFLISGFTGCTSEEVAPGYHVVATDMINEFILVGPDGGTVVVPATVHAFAKSGNYLIVERYNYDRSREKYDTNKKDYYVVEIIPKSKFLDE